MAVAAPTRRSSAAPAPAPSRTKPPKRKAPARQAPTRKPPRSRAVPAPAKAPARRAPARKPAPKRAPATARPKLALAAGRTAVAVRSLPDSGLVVRMTRGRAWIGVLGALLVGIVALNVATLSVTASAGKIDQQIQTLGQENSVLRARLAQRLSNQRVQAQAAALGLATPDPQEIEYREAGPAAVQAAARRLAAAG